MDTEHSVFPSITYLHKMDHRDQSEKKSQWSISMDEERQCFTSAISFNWILLECNCWGLHLKNGKATYLGTTAKNEPKLRQLFIAKFIDGNKDNKWHGYPADPCNEKQQDIPPDFIRKSWLERQYLRPQTVRKISRGQKCEL